MRQTWINITVYSFLLLLILTSCCNKPLVGIYKDESRGTFHSITLFDDSTFSYKSEEGQIDDSSEGKWTKRRCNLILNSFISYEDICSYYITEHCDTCSEGINGIIAFHGSEMPVYYAIIKCYSEGKVLIENTSCFDGKFKIEEANIDSLRIEFVSLDPISFIPNNRDSILYKVVMKDERLERKVILNEVWKIKKNKLIYQKGLILRKVQPSSNI